MKNKGFSLKRKKKGKLLRADTFLMIKDMQIRQNEIAFSTYHIIKDKSV